MAVLGVLPLARAEAVAPLYVASPLVCDGPAGDPDPAIDPAAWIERDLNNIACGNQRQLDNASNPAFMRKWAIEVAKSWGEMPRIVLDQLSEPTRPRINPVYWVPMSKVTDPFRTPEEWQAAGRGQMQRFHFIASTGAKLAARLYSPNPGRGNRRLPGVAFIPGLQSYNEVNSWFAQGLAEAGYIVLIIDPQGQGDSENLPHNPDGSIDCSFERCPNVPTDDIPETRSAIDFLLSTPDDPHPHAVGPNADGTLRHNPLWARLDPGRIGLAGHSLGALAVTRVGQEDRRVKAIVSYDNLGATLPAEVVPHIHAPTLLFGADYDFPQPPLPKSPWDPPDPTRLMGQFHQIRAAGVDTMTVVPRASAHYEWGYQPFPASFSASRYGERTSFYFTRAWFDRYLKGERHVTGRLTTLTFGGSADESSIGSGTFDAEAATEDPTDPGAGNVPYRIEGKCVANLLSFYHHSAYSLEGGRLASDDMRSRGCR